MWLGFYMYTVSYTVDYFVSLGKYDLEKDISIIFAMSLPVILFLLAAIMKSKAT